MDKIKFVDRSGRFEMDHPEMYHNLYFPIASEMGLKSVVTPNLNGDSKLDQNTFLLEPVSIENLHNNRSGRNFWCRFEEDQKEQAPWSAVGNSTEAEAQVYAKEKDSCKVSAGYMYHTVTRSSKRCKLTATVTSFVPWNENVEVMQVVITNDGEEAVCFTPIAAIPVYGRSADNIRDHRHVTSLLHRIATVDQGVLVRPTLSFDERGHQKNEITYFVCGMTGQGKGPVSFFPTVNEFLGDAGTYTNPEAVMLHKEGLPSGTKAEGCEAVGAFAFEKTKLQPNESASYTILIGATKDEKELPIVLKKFEKEEAVKAAKEETENYWNEKVNVSFTTGNIAFDNYMKWVCFQPFLRRVYGCSFLPHHDYGKGGRGWRDLWQDCLALLIMDPKDVHDMIVSNFGGVRVDGTNATIIGSKQGEFIADRNNITRVWMDHGMWPFLTTKLYMEQTGDLGVLTELAPYFKDRQVKRGTAIDVKWFATSDKYQTSTDGVKYTGTVLEHLLFQHVLAMLEQGEHGNILLRGADWNDAIDMAGHKGESVAFTCAYAGNLIELAKYIRKLEKFTGEKNCKLLKEFVELLEANNLREANEAYLEAVTSTVSGEQKEVAYAWLADWLEKEGNRMMDHIRANEWTCDSKGNGWFNSYYDDHGNRVEGETKDGVRMMLTGQVFSIMSHVAKEEQVASIVKSADTYLYEKEVGGYKLNTDFKEEKYDMGRMFGFAYGEKENGAVFSHMTVMYANALYQRGFIREGYKALQTLADTALDFETSQIFPGIPEYFNAKGKGLYHYLTGAASWYELSMVTEVFGVRGAMGDLCLSPKLVKEQFDFEKKAQISLVFADKKLTVTYVNEKNLDAKEYAVTGCTMDGVQLWTGKEASVVIPREKIAELSDSNHEIVVTIG